MTVGVLLPLFQYRTALLKLDFWKSEGIARHWTDVTSHSRFL